MNLLSSLRNIFSRCSWRWVGPVLISVPLSVAMASTVRVSLHPDKDDDRLQLVHADEWDYDEFVNPDAQCLTGHVEFLHKGMRLKCDSAVYYERANSFKAFGHVVMTQGDTLSLTGDHLFYYGEEQIAEARHHVVLKHRGQVLTTDSLNYDRIYQYAYFFEGGTLTDADNQLTSDWGEYHTDTRKSSFYYAVTLTNPKFRIDTDTLHYDTYSKWTDIAGPSNIYSGESKIYTERGRYNTESGQAELFDRSQCFNRGSSLTGDSLFYNKNTGVLEAFRNVEYRDSTSKCLMTGHYARYNEQTGEALAHDSALAREFSNPRDTLYVHADTLRMRTMALGTDTAYRLLRGYYHARAYRSDVQAVADSLFFNSKENKLSLYKDPIVWNENRQIVGEEIHVYANENTIDSVYVREQAMVVERLDSLHYNQVSGQLMRSYFENGEMRLNCVDGNVYVANFPLEKDSIVVYQNYTETAKLRMYMKDKKLSRIWAPGSSGSFYVAALAPEEKRRLANFSWFDYIRPLDKYDLFQWRPKKSGTELRPSVRRIAPIQNLKKKDIPEVKSGQPLQPVPEELPE